MARFLNPLSAEYIEGCVLPRGRFAGESLAQVARSKEGLQYLARLLQNKDQCHWMSMTLKNALVMMFAAGSRRQQMNRALRGVEESVAIA